MSWYIIVFLSVTYFEFGGLPVYDFSYRFQLGLKTATCKLRFSLYLGVGVGGGSFFLGFFTQFLYYSKNFQAYLT